MSAGSRPPVPIELRTAHDRPLAERFGPSRPLDDAFVTRLAGLCTRVDTDVAARIDAGRDWWPLALVWALEGVVPARPEAVARPATAAEAAAILRACNEAAVPVTAAGGRSGVCGGSVPVFGGVSIDLTGLAGVVDVDDISLLVDVKAGTFLDTFEETLRTAHDLTLGHWPQSMALATIGGALACRGAGQYSTRYGKIEDMAVGLEVALPDGRLIRTGGRAPRSATGPDLTQLFVGSEGTLGLITEARLRTHLQPPLRRQAAFAFADFSSGLDACRRILRRGATPAVLRLYDKTESSRSFETEGVALLIVVDEGDPGLVDASMAVVFEECRVAEALDTADNGIVSRWLEHRNALPPLEALVRGGIVADTIEIAGSWAALPAIYRDAVTRLMDIDGTFAASAHQSHAYTDGACLYFTFAGRPPAGHAHAEAYYRQAWDAVTATAVDAGGALSHHHGIGVNRSRYLRDYLGGGFEVLVAIKRSLDPNGILNPGKLGLPSPFGAPPWP